MSSNKGLVGIELFKSDVRKVLLASKDHKLETCQFKLAYKKIFGKDFNHQKYGLSKKKLTTYFEDISDIITFENDRKFVILKAKAKSSQDETAPRQVASCKGNSQSLENDKTRVSKDQSVKAKNTSSTSGISGVSSTFPSRTMKNVESQPLPTSSVKTTSKHVVEPKEKQLKTQDNEMHAHSDSPSSDGSLSGIEYFKAKVRELLQDKGNCKIEIGQFVHLYKQKFKTAFNPEVYGFKGRKKISALLEKIPDVVLLERIGSSFYMKLNSATNKSVKKEADDVIQTKTTQSSPDVKSLSRSQSTKEKQGSAVTLNHKEQEQQEKKSSDKKKFDAIPGLFESSSSSPLSSSSKHEYSRTDSWGETSAGNGDVLIPQASLINSIQPKHPVPNTNSDSVKSRQTLSGIVTPDILSQSRLTSAPSPVAVPQNTRSPLVMPVLPATSVLPGTPVLPVMSGLQGKSNQVLGNHYVSLPPSPPQRSGFATPMIPTSSLGLHHLASNISVSPLTTGLPSTSSSPRLPSRKMESNVPSLVAIMQEQIANSLEEANKFPSLPPPAPLTKSRRSKAVDLYSDDDDDGEQSSSGTPGPFEQSFNLAYDSPRPSSSVKKGASTKLSLQEINEITKQVRESISSEGHHVSLEIVKYRLCKRLGVNSLNELGRRKPDVEIQELKELSRLLSKLDLYGRAYVMVHSISTIPELGQGMAKLLDKKDFLDLQVGPLVKLPVVYDLFKAPSDDTVIQRVTTLHILKHLNQYLTKKGKWTSKVELEDFMKYLCDIYGCSTPYELGVRIQSMGLGISVLKRAQKSQSEKSKEVEQELANDIGREIEKRCKKIKGDLLGSSPGDERSLLHKLLGSSVIDLIINMFDHCQELFKPEPLKKVNKFLEAVTTDKSLRDLFNLAIHMGCKDIVKKVLEDYKAEVIKEAEENEKSKARETSKPPAKSTLIKETKKWLSAAEDLDLSTLATIEKRLSNGFPGFDVFSDFGYGTWLEFLTNEKELYKLLEGHGALICGESKNNKAKVDLNSILDFVSQCGPKATEDLVCSALCEHYHVTSLSDLGVKSYKTLMEQSTQRKPQHSVICELALLCKEGDTNVFKHHHVNTKDEAKPRAGLLGWKSKDDAVIALASTPLLGNMKEWTQWDAVFKPCLGDLKHFIEQESLNKRDDGIQIQALETEDGSLLKVNINVSVRDFEKSVNERDVIGTAGHLVSLVIMYGGILATPLTLMINHINSMLLKLTSADQEDDGQRCPRFVLQCLCRIPERMCVALASRVFLEPLGTAVGTGSSNQLLLSCCDTYKQRCCLHHLGLTLGHTEWVEDFKSVISGENEKQVLEEERKKILQELRPVAIIKPVTFESIQQEQEVQEPVVEVDEPLESAPDETLTAEGVTEDKASIDEEEVTDTISERNTCKALIESIRKEEFGIGVILGVEESKLVQKQRDREGRSLHRLSAELYSRDTHFVLELIQNADDNTFETDTPTLVFNIEPHAIMVLNNEVGFKEENIRALCDVGKSTKGAHQYGYIGQKGIGFKSVFRVSDQPEVHSNGYHICFKAKSGPSGYILPHWIDDNNDPSAYRTNQSADMHDLQLDSWMTRIVLPLKEEFHGDKKNSLSARFNDVHPSLLLFLHRLRSIILIKKNKIQKMTRQDLDNDIIQISDDQGTNRWLVIKKQLKVVEAREDVEMTELALAFPMPKEEKTTHQDLHTKTLPAQNVFAYLPLRSYGFKFIIQGDFEVPSSREDVDGDKAWNQWLREEIPKLFIDALDIFKCHPHFSGLTGVAKFFQFVPLKEEILDFFNPVADMILRHLQGMNCLPVEKVVAKDGSDGCGSQYDWMQPCKVVVCEDTEIMNLIPPELLQRHLGLHYLVPDLISPINPALRQELGIKTLSVKHLIEVGKSVMKDDLMQDSLKKVQWIAQWLHCVYRCLEREHNSSSEIMDQISAMNIFPLSDNTFVHLKDNAIFFPLSVNQQSLKAKKKHAASTAKYLRELEKDLSVLNPELLNHLGSVGHSQVEKLLQQLGVKSWTAKDVIHNHILPTLKSDQWKGKTPNVLQSYLVYIFNERVSDPRVCELDELKDCAQVLTNKGPKNPCKMPVHFTPKYGNPLDLSVDIPNISWTLIDDSYLNETSTSVGRQELAKFFSALGVQHFLVIERRLVTLNKMNLDTSPWASRYEMWPETSDGAYVIEDSYCEELDEFMSKPTDPRQAKVLAENLDREWKDHYYKYEDKIPLKDSEGRELQGHSTMSSFLLNLKTRAWLPVLQSNTCCEPSTLYLNTKELHGVLDDHVQYVGVNIQNLSFAKVLGVTLSVSLDSLLHQLIRWSHDSRLAGQSKGFSTSLAHMKNVYQYIHDKFKASQSDDIKCKITSAFQKHPLIFFPRDSYLATKKPDQKTVGEFHHMKEVCWRDPSDVAIQLLKLKKYTAKRQILSVCYNSFSDFFGSCLKVDRTPHSDEYIEMASVLVSENPLPTPSVLGLVIEIFAVLGSKCLAGPLNESNYTRVDNANYAHTEVSLEEERIDPATAGYLKRKLAKEDIFPCATRWVSLSDEPILPDSKRLKKIFEKEKDVHFILIEQPSQKPGRRLRKSDDQKKKNELVKVFFRACGIPKLSDCVEETLTTTKVAYQCREVQQYFHQIVPCVQRYIYHQMPEPYSHLVDSKFPEMLAEMTFATVDTLEVVYHIKHLPQVTVLQQEKYGHECHEDKIFFHAVKNQVEIAQPLNQAIVKLFGAGSTDVDKKFENFLELLRMHLDDLEDFLSNQDIERLPEEERQWFVPAPEILKSPEPVEEEIPEPVFQAEKAPCQEYENDGTLHSWPPRAPITSTKISFYPSAQGLNEKTLEMWPVPEAPESIKKEVLTDPVPKKIPPVESCSESNVQTPGTVSTQDDGPRDRTLSSQESTANAQGSHAQQNKTATDQQKPVTKETPHPETDTAASNKYEESKGYSHPKSTINAERSFASIFSPDMQVSLQDLEFEHLSTEGFTLPEGFTMKENPDKEVIGRWGEWLVYEYLKNDLQHSTDIEVKWMNEGRDSLQPYDIQINKIASQAPQTTFIEVKSTSGDDKEYFEISTLEIKFALERRENLHLYRVFNAGNPCAIRITRAKNLAAYLEKKTVKVFMVI